ncbi:hypothetical protein [Sorangium sp. So ce1335]|uniref:hypothetical protein n=1 Tax=Sorangium sp. So ce1335 TaxID=3133335 RepID=UPI003F634257
MCGTGAADGAGLCQDAAVERDGGVQRAAEPGVSARALPACKRRSFVRQFAGASATLRGFAVDTSGRTLLAGSFEGELAFGGTRLESAGESDAFVARLDACGDLLWATQLGDAGEQRAIDVVAGSGGSALVLGAFTGTLELGAHRLTAGSSWGSDLFVAKLGPNGAVRWAAQISGEEDAILGGTALAVDRDGHVRVLGKLEGAARVGGARGARIERRGLGTFVVRLDASGRFVWASLPPSGSDTEEIGIEVDDNGNAILAAQDARGSATFVTKLDEDGDVAWHKRFRGSSEQLEMAYDIAVDPDGAALLSGNGVFGDPGLPGGPRPFLAKIGDDGEVLWVKRFDAQSPRQVTASERGVVLAGDALCDAGACSAWTAGLSEDGEAQWTQRLGVDVQIVGLELDPWEKPMMAGFFRGTLALGSASFSSDQGALFVSRVTETD